MRSLLCSLGFAAALMGQTVTVVDDVAFVDLGSTLTRIGKAEGSRAALSQRLAGNMFAMAILDHEPSRALVVSFADDLTAVIFGKALTNHDVDLLQQSIRDVLRGSRPTYSSAANLRKTLTRVDVDPTKSQLVTRRFMAIGEEIKGPDDLPLTKGPQQLIRRAPQK